MQAGDLSGASVRSAVRSADGATRKLGTSLRKLGAPDTPSGQRAKQIVGTLAGRLEAEVGTIAAGVRKASGAAGVLEAVAAGGATLAKMRTQVTRALDRLQRLDNGPLANGFLDARSCNHLVGSA